MDFYTFAFSLFLGIFSGGVINFLFHLILDMQTQITGIRNDLKTLLETTTKDAKTKPSPVVIPDGLDLEERAITRKELTNMFGSEEPEAVTLERKKNE